jgi:hypothetical protein
MKISFDLDDTLLFREDSWRGEPDLPPLQQGISNECLGAGVCELFREPIALECEIWIYAKFSAVAEMIRLHVLASMASRWRRLVDAWVQTVLQGVRQRFGG